MKIFIVVSIILIGATLSTPLLAADAGNSWMKGDRFTLGVGIFFVEEDTEVTISSDALGVGTPVNFQDDLGFDEGEEALRIAGHYRFNPRHRINFGYWSTSRDSKTTLTKDIKFDETFFPAGTQVKTDLDFAVMNILYTYSFFQTDAIDLGFSTGVSIYDFDSEIRAPGAGLDEGGDGTAPFPVVGLRIRHNFKPKWNWGASWDYFEIDESDVEGQVVDILIAVEYKVWNDSALGFAYNDVSIDAEDKEDKDELDWDYDGFFGYVRFSR